MHESKPIKIKYITKLEIGIALRIFFGDRLGLSIYEGFAEYYKVLVGLNWIHEGCVLV